MVGWFWPWRQLIKDEVARFLSAIFFVFKTVARQFADLNSLTSFPTPSGVFPSQYYAALASLLELILLTKYLSGIVADFFISPMMNIFPQLVELLFIGS